MQKPPSSLPAFLWHFLRPHRLGVLGLVGTGVFWALEMSFKPYLVKLLVDGIVAYSETAENLFNLVVLPAIFYVVLLEANNFNYRMMDFIKLRLIPNLERDISTSMFDYLERHSYRYFQNQFAGNLSNKVMDMARGVGDFTFVLTLAMTIVWEVWRLADSLVGFSQELGICRQAIAIVTIPHEIVDAPRAKRLNISDGAIVFDKVSFHYVPGRDIFKHKTIEIQGGQRVGLVGSSGVGKTTFVNLILRFFNVQNGRILIDGQDISQVKRESLHEQIAMIPQDPGLFHRTLMENIRYGRLDATDEEVIAASQKGHCHEFIEQIEGGYQALVGERGIKLSGGQRQRIAISRAILKNAPILILDEATSALDSITEKYIQKSLEDLMRDRTTIAIAHRLSTLATMDRILVFKDGQIVEDGTHAKLLEQKSHYFHLWRMQVGGFLPRESNNGENSIV